MIFSFYLALWITNFNASAFSTLKSPFWECISVVPGLICAALYLYIIKCAALLKAIVSMDLDIVEETIEHSEAVYQLSLSIREMVLKELDDVTDAEEALHELYNRVDVNKGDALR
jgi:hypothetical protein